MRIIPLALLLVVGGASGAGGGPGVEGARAAGSGLAERTEGPVVAPRGGPPGTEVSVRMDGLPPNTRMVIGFGAPRAGYEWIGRAETDAEGSLATAVEVPASAQVDELHYFFVTLPEQPPFGTSAGFHVTDPEGVLRVTGEIMRGSSGSLALRGAFDELYCLSGEVQELEVGARASVEGVIADGSDCPAGIPVDVRRRQE